MQLSSRQVRRQEVPQGPVPHRGAPGEQPDDARQEQRQEAADRQDRQAQLRDHPPADRREPPPGTRTKLCQQYSSRSNFNLCSPFQVLVNAIINSGPREDSTRIGRAGTVRRQAVDVSPLRRVNQVYKMTVFLGVKSSNQTFVLGHLAAVHRSPRGCFPQHQDHCRVSR